MEQVLYKLPDGWEWRQLQDVVVKTENLNLLKHADQLWTYIDISSVDRNRFTVTDPKKILGKDAPSRAKKHVQLNDVIFATTRPNLKNIALIRDEYSLPVASTGFCVLRANEKVLPAYLFYFVTTDFFQAQIEPYVGGASYPAITDGNLKKAPIPIPNFKEQKRIVKKIDALLTRIDTAIEYLQESVTLADAMYAGVLDNQFNPSNALVDKANLYELPEGWEWKLLCEIADKITDGTHHSPKVQYAEWKEGRYKYITSKNIKNGWMSLENISYIDGFVHDKIYERCAPEYNDQLITKDGAMTGTCCLNELDEPFSLLSSVALVKQKRSVVLPRYLNYYLQSYIGQNFLLGDISGAAITRTNINKLKSIPVPICSIDTQGRIVKIIDENLSFYNDLKDALHEKIGGLNMLKASILDSAFKGEL